MIGIMAAEALAEVLKRRGDAETLARMMVESRPEASRVLLHELAELPPTRSAASSSSRRSSQSELEEPRSEAEKDRLAERQALAAIGLEVLGEPDWVSSLLRLQPRPSRPSLADPSAGGGRAWAASDCSSG